MCVRVVVGQVFESVCVTAIVGIVHQKFVGMELLTNCMINGSSMSSRVVDLQQM